MRVIGSTEDGYIVELYDDEVHAVTGADFIELGMDYDVKQVDGPDEFDALLATKTVSEVMVMLRNVKDHLDQWAKVKSDNA